MMLAISVILTVTIIRLHGSIAVSEPFPVQNLRLHSDSRCPSTQGTFGICAFMCSEGGCGPGRICCPTACGGTSCHTPREPPPPQPIPSPCPPDVPMASCTHLPCDKERCPNHPHAKCVNNYCGGCNAKFYKNGKEVTKTCKKFTPRLPPACPNGQRMVHCLVNPCDVQQCPRLPNAACVADYCGGCNARFYHQGKEVTKSCKQAPPTGPGIPPPCPNGQQMVNCLINPCDVQQCPLLPNAVCVPDYCGGCNAKFFIGESEVTIFCRRPPFYLFRRQF